MKYQAYRIEFQGLVHLGKHSLDDTACSFRADTLFSALCIEAVRRSSETLATLVSFVREEKLRFTDAFPYMGDRYYLPKPYLHIENKLKPGDSSIKKAYKNMLYIPVDQYTIFLQGMLPAEQTGLLKGLGHKSMKTSVSIRGLDEPMPYRVSTYRFNEGNGLYLILAYEDQSVRDFTEDLLSGVALEGIGGKRSSGFGRFEFFNAALPKELENRFSKEYPHYITLSSALPADEEMENALDGASYQVIRRSGFVASDHYAPQQMRKKDLYVFSVGSCFKNRFQGVIADVSAYGNHPVYRYAKPFFMGVDV